jgi:surface polysaccharide O-acyltransferase-like enzyme
MWGIWWGNSRMGAAYKPFMKISIFKGVVLSRIESVDIFKFLAITAVIAIHTEPFHSRYWGDADGLKYLSAIIEQFARFAVPFFFVISGYFWGSKVKKSVSIASVSIPMAKKIFLIFAAWSVIYALFNFCPTFIKSMGKFGLLEAIKVTYWYFISLTKHPITLLMEGTEIHLWFLSALLCSLGISSLFIAKKYYKTLITLSVTLYLVGLFAKSYSVTPFGLHIDFDTRYGPFFGTIFFVSGYFLSNLIPNFGWFSRGIFLFAFGWLLQFSEVYLLWSLYGTSSYQNYVMDQDYVVGTYFMGLGAAVSALSNIAFLRNKVLSNIGQFTLGIYAVHFIFVDMLRPIGKLTYSWLWEIGYVLLVLLFSTVSVIVLSKNKITRKLVV